MTILCSGSLALDIVMSHSGLFGETILPDKLPQINICYLTDHLNHRYGGTAGNIAYNLALMGEKPLVLATVGQDGEHYLERLTGLGLSREGIKSIPEVKTSTCYLAHDSQANQLIFFHSGAMNHSCGFDPGQFADPEKHLAIVAPGNMADMKRFSASYRELELPFIFDPGQQITAFRGEDLLEMLNGAKIFIVNEYELSLFLKITGKKDESSLFEYTETLIVTMGEKGSRLIVPYKGSTHVASVRPRQVVEPTGAGDAFRAGLIKGIISGLPLAAACRLGSTAASFCLEAAGPQEHEFSLAQLAARHRAAFKEDI